MKNLKGFLALTLLISTAKVVEVIPMEVVNLLVNHKDYEGGIINNDYRFYSLCDWFNFI